jgi:DNA polymerase elongation subunit (family B)
MSYKKCYAERVGYNQYKIHLWEDSGYSVHKYSYPAYEECEEYESEFKGLQGEYLKKTLKWDKSNPKLHFHDMPPYQRYLLDKYGTNDQTSQTHREVFFDIEIEMGDALTPEYIKKAPKKVTSIAWYDKQVDEWGIYILDEKNKLSYTKTGNREVIPVSSEMELLAKWLEKFREIDPDILVGYNSDYFDIPYLYYRTCKILGEEYAHHFSPIGVTKERINYQTGEIYNPDQPIEIAGVEPLDYMRLHKKYSWEDEPSWTLAYLGEKYAGLGKIEYDGSLDRLFETDIDKFIEYNFRDVEILVEWDKKSKYLALTKNLSHKGKINYSDVYASSKVHDGAISAFLLSQNIIPPARDRNPIIKKNYAGGYLFCPKAGIYRYVFDEDLTSLYPSIIMSINIGKETLVGRIVDDNDRNNRLGLNDLKQKDPNQKIIVENSNRKRTQINIGKLIDIIESNKFSISANGVFFRTDKKSVLYTVLNKWFDERVEYKNLMKKAYKSGDIENGEQYHLLQYTQKILLNSLYGALALKGFRYGNVLLAEATTLSGQRIIQESALTANRHINKVIRGEESLSFQ